MNAIILIAHGSKKASSNNEFLSMVKKIKENSKYDFTEASFLEIASPGIKTITKELIKKGVRQISFYPFFLNSGKHVLIDIPNIIEELKKEYELVNFKLLEHFGKSNKINEIILSEINQK